MGLDLSTVGQVAGGVIGAYFGGPIGATAGSQLGGKLGDVAEGVTSSKKSSSSSGGSQSASWSPASCGPRPTGSGLTTDRKSVIDTGRYLIKCKNGEIEVFDKLSNTSFRAWGDPHLHTSDGDKAQFHEDLGIELDDGTRLEFDVTEKDAQGIALIENLSVMKGNQAVRVEGLTGDDGFTIGNVLNNASQVDALINPITSLVAGKQVDDLTFKNSGKEIVGNDPSQPFGEIRVDRGDTPAVGGPGCVKPLPITPGMSIQQILYMVIQLLEDTLRTKSEELATTTNQFQAESRMAKDEQQKLGDGAVGEGDLNRLQGQVQSLAQAMKQLTELASNLLQIDGAIKDTIIQNTRA